MTEHAKNGQQRGKDNVKNFSDWQDAMSDQDYVQIVYRGSLNRKIIAEQCCFAKSVLGSNPKVKEELEKLENSLRERNVLPQLTAKGKAEQNKPKSLNIEAIKSAREQSRVPALEQQIVELKAEVAALKGRLGRFSELSDVYQEMAEMK
jgi:hypothetical protein